MRSRNDLIVALTFIILALPLVVILAVAGTKVWLIAVCALIFIGGGVLLLVFAPKEYRLTGRDHKWRPITVPRLKRRYGRWRHERQFHRTRPPRR